MMVEMPIGELLMIELFIGVQQWLYGEVIEIEDVPRIRELIVYLDGENRMCEVPS